MTKTIEGGPGILAVPALVLRPSRPCEVADDVKNLRLSDAHRCAVHGHFDVPAETSPFGQVLGKPRCHLGFRHPVGSASPNAIGRAGGCRFVHLWRRSVL